MTNVFMNSVSVVFDVQVPSAQVELLFPPDMGWFSVTESERDRVLMGTNCQILFAQSAAHAQAFQAAHVLGLGLNIQFEPIAPGAVIAIVDVPDTEAFPVPLTLQLLTDDGRPIGVRRNGAELPVEANTQIIQPDDSMPRGPGNCVRQIFTISFGLVPLTPGRTYVWAAFIGGTQIGSAPFRVLADAELQRLQQLATANASEANQ